MRWSWAKSKSHCVWTSKVWRTRLENLNWSYICVPFTHQHLSLPSQDYTLFTSFWVTLQRDDFYELDPQTLYSLQCNCSENDACVQSDKKPRQNGDWRAGFCFLSTILGRASLAFLSLHSRRDLRSVMLEIPCSPLQSSLLSCPFTE